MPLLRFDEVSLAFGREPLLDRASFQIDAGERVCLIGRNGAGKSTLLKLADGQQAPESGVVRRQPGLRISQLAQELSVSETATVFDVVAGGLPEIASRVGIDLAPVDCRDEQETRWLLACILADRLDRVERFGAALALARRDPPRLVRGDFTRALAEVAAGVPPQQQLCLLDSYSLVYLAPEERAELAATIAALARDRDLDWISSERPGTIPGLVEPAPPEDAHATFVAWSAFRGGRRRDRVLARAHTHGAWVEWL